MKTTKLTTQISTTIFMATLALAALPARADYVDLRYGDDVRLGEAGYGGTGCPAGSAWVGVGDDRRSLQVHFDGFAVEAGRGTSRSIDRRNCNVALPLHVPAGYSVALVGQEVTGFAAIDAGAQVSASVEIFLAGSRGPLHRETLTGPTYQDFSVGTTFSKTTWSECGFDVTLRMNVSLLATGRSGRAYAELDGFSFPQGRIIFRRCN